VILGLDVWSKRFVHATFIAFNGGMLVYAVVRLMGVRESVEDLRVAWSVQPSSGDEAPAGESLA